MTDQPLTIDAVFEDFATSDGKVPRASMQWALDNWDIAGPRCLDLLSRYTDGTDRTEATENALLFVSRLVAEKQETAAFGPICRLLHEYDAAPFFAGDAISAKLSQILISTFDGNLDTLRELVEDANADVFYRYAAIEANAYLTRVGRIPEADTRDWMQRLATAMQPQEESLIWNAWVDSVAALGFADLADDVRRVIQQGFVGSDPERITEGVADFDANLRQTLDDPDRMVLFVEKELAPFADGINELGEWYEPSDPITVDGLLDDDEDLVASPWPWTSGGGDRNPWRDVGRNDPCPCGSGKKFKKCCLPKDVSERPLPIAARAD
jgi:hypothetical protein